MKNPTNGNTEQPATAEQRKNTKGIGTLIYQAPEIIRGETDYPIDKTDIYSMGILLLEVFTQKEPYSEPPFDKLSKWEIEKFVSSGKRIEVPKTVHPKIRELICKCWDNSPLKRPDFSSIVKVLTEVMDSFPTEEIKEVVRERGGSTVGSDIKYVPNGDLNSIGWLGDIERRDCETKLKGTSAGTFALRWSNHTASYVLSFQSKDGPQHIAFITPDFKTGQITVDKEDGKKACYDSIFDYIKAMKDNRIITEPLRTIVPIQEDLYGKTPTAKGVSN